MEPTQELNLSQDLAPTLPDQVGILGIEGEMHPIITGVNKIGRDPSKCSIVINANSLSRQHALIDVKRNKSYGYDCTLIDMNSRNQTKLRNSCLQPFKPALLEDGDVIHLGDIIGVFRLCNTGVESDLPMTQAMDDTPVRQTQTPARNRTMQRTVVPESPDFSDKDDSCNISTHSTSGFKVPKLLRPIKGCCRKTDADSSLILNQSDSINLFLDDADGSSMNDSAIETTIHVKHREKSIHEIETQPPDVGEKDEDSIHNVDTQSQHGYVCPAEIQTSLPPEFFEAATQGPSLSIQEEYTQKFSPSIHTAETQGCPDSFIHNDDPQIPSATNNSPINDTDVFTKAITDIPEKTNPESVQQSEDTHQMTESDEEIIFDEFETQGLGGFGSQPLIPTSPPVEVNSSKPSSQPQDDDILEQLEEAVEDMNLSPIAKSKTNKKVSRIIEDSDSSTDCEDIHLMMTQKISTIPVSDDDLTDCEEDIDNAINNSDKCLNRSESISELPTQILDETNECDDISELPTQIISERSSLFKPNINGIGVPNHSIHNSPVSVIPSILHENSIDADLDIGVLKSNENNDYYNNTQDLISDLCTQKIENSSFKIPSSKAVKSKRTPKKPMTKHQDLNQSGQEVLSSSKNLQFGSDNSQLDLAATEDIVMSSQKDDDIGPRFPGLEDDLDAQKTSLVQKLYTGSKDINIQHNCVSTALSSLERETPSDNAHSQSDLSDDGTPKKNLSKHLLEIDLPDSQEIKKVIKPTIFTSNSETSSGSDQEQDSEQYTPIVFKKKTRVTKNVKVDLVTKFNLDMGTRVSTRIRKPTAKLEETEEISCNFLKSKHSQDSDIDSDIISDNIKKLTNRVKPKNKSNKKEEIFSKGDILQSKSKKQVKSDDIDGKQPLSHINVIDDRGCGKKELIKEAISEEELNNISNTKKTKRNVTEIVPEKLDTKTSKKDKTNEKKTSKNAEAKSKCLENKKSKSATRIASNEIKDDVPTDEEVPLKRRRRLNENTLTDKCSQDDITIKNKSIRKSNRNVNKPKPICQSKENKTTKVSPRDTNKISTNVAERKSQRKGNNINSQVNTYSQQQDSTTKPINSKMTESKDKTKKINKSDNSIESLGSQSDSSHSRLSNNSSNNTSSTKSTRAMRASKYDLSKIYQATEFSPERKETRKRSAPTYNEKAKKLKTIKDCFSPSRSSSRNSNFEKNVLFSAYTGNKMLEMLKNIGATTVSDVESCSVLVTKQLKRTAKIICAIGLGKPIVGPSWLLACKEANTFINPWLHILKDADTEGRYKFDLKKLLSGPRDFLKGYNMSCTPHTMPPAPELKLMVEYSGGCWREGGDKWVCLSAREDGALWPALRRRGAQIVSAELLLSGIFVQKVDVRAHSL